MTDSILPSEQKTLNAGDHFTINPYRGLGIDPNTRPFIGEECVVIETCKSGLIQVKMCENKKIVKRIGQINQMVCSMV